MPANVIPDPAKIAAAGLDSFGADLLRLTPAIIDEATASSLGIWSCWSSGPGGDGRLAALAATDVALTLGQPRSTSIYFLAGTGEAAEVPDPDFAARARRVCVVRGFRFVEPAGGTPRWIEDVPAPADLWNGSGMIGRRRLLTLAGRL